MAQSVSLKVLLTKEDLIAFANRQVLSTYAGRATAVSLGGSTGITFALVAVIEPATRFRKLDCHRSNVELLLLDTQHIGDMLIVLLFRRRRWRFSEDRRGACDGWPAGGRRRQRGAGLVRAAAACRYTRVPNTLQLCGGRVIW